MTLIVIGLVGVAPETALVVTTPQAEAPVSIGAVIKAGFKQPPMLFFNLSLAVAQPAVLATVVLSTVSL